MQVGGSIGTAVLNTVAITATTTYLAEHGRSARVAGLVHGYAAATLGAAALLVGVAVAAAVMITTPGPVPSATSATS
jgi:hypothetical protein